MSIRINTKIVVKGSLQNAADMTFVVERILRTVDAEGHTRYAVEARSERQRCFGRSETGYTTWRLSYITACVEEGTMAIVG